MKIYDAQLFKSINFDRLMVGPGICINFLCFGIYALTIPLWWSPIIGSEAGPAVYTRLLAAVISLPVFLIAFLANLAWLIAILWKRDWQAGAVWVVVGLTWALGCGVIGCIFWMRS